jgi:sulfoxide reductase heme-binding subunit YedZ
MPWRDRTGRLSPLKAVTFVLCLVPALWTAAALALGALGPRPYDAVIHELGLWTFRLILITLAVTPARKVFGWSRLIQVRRMLGVAAAAYAVAHLVAYAANEAFDLGKVASEIVLRLYLTIGFVALLGLLALAVTSTDGMIRRLGALRWQRLHRLVYPILLLGLVHFFMQAKLEVYEPTLMAGLFGWLMLYRAAGPVVGRSWQSSLPMLFLLALVTGLGTAFGEAFYLHLLTGAPFDRILGINLMTLAGVRPGPLVLATGIGVVALAVVARLARRLREPATFGIRSVPIDAGE